MRKKTLRLIAIIVMVLLVICGGTLVYYNESLKPTGSAEESVIVHVEQGSSFQMLIDELKETGLIRNTFVAKIYLKLSGTSNLQANTYELNKGMSLPEIMKIVSTGDFNYLHKVQMTIQEGLTLPEVAQIVAEIVGQSKEEVLKQWSDSDYLNTLINDYWFLDGEAILQEGIMFPLEGYLYPETYTNTNGSPTIDELTRMMLDQTSIVLEKYRSDIEALGMSIHEFLSFASVVERESLFDEDRPMIAGVFWNRLEDGMALQSDITVLYAHQRTGIDVSYDDLEIDSYYNTYMYPGLPIGPISNVSDVTIQSCVDFSKHDYYYFYAGPDGKVYYAKTLEEHEENQEAHPWN